MDPFCPPNIKTLDMSLNGLTGISEAAFYRLAALQSLNLQVPSTAPHCSTAVWQSAGKRNTGGGGPRIRR